MRRTSPTPGAVRAPPSSDSARLLGVAGAAAALAFVVAAAAAPDWLARLIRHVLPHVTLRHALIFAAAVGVLAAAGSLVPRDWGVRRHVDAPARLARRIGAALGWLVDRPPWGVVVAAIAAVAAAGWYVLSRATSVPHVFSDELIHAELARTLARDGTLAAHGYGFVTPIIDSIAYLVTSSDVSAYRLIQLFNVLVMVTAALPAYLLARRALSHRWALVVAALAVTVPWMSYSALVMTEAAFYPIFLLFVLALIRALERPTRGRQLVLALALVLACVARTQAFILAGAVIVAVLVYGWARVRFRATVRAFLPTSLLYGVAGGLVIAASAAGRVNPLGNYSVLLHGGFHPHGLLLWAASNVTAFTLSVGVLAVVAAPLGVAVLLRRRASDGEAAFVAAAVPVTLALLVTVVVLSQSAYGLGGVHERNLFYVAPLVFICAFAWATRGFPRPWLLVAVTAIVLIGLAALMPRGPIVPYSEAMSFKLWSQLGYDQVKLARVMIVAVAGGVLVLLRLRSAWPLVFVIVLSAVAATAARDYQSPQPRALTPQYTWVDRRLAPGDTAMVLWISAPKEPCPAAAPSSPLPKMAVYTEFFNSRVDRVGEVGGDNPARGLLSDALEVRPDGVIAKNGAPLRPRFVIADARLEFAGRRVAALRASDLMPAAGDAGYALALWRVTPPLRLAKPAQVLDPTQLRRLACTSPGAAHSG